MNGEGGAIRDGPPRQRESPTNDSSAQGQGDGVCALDLRKVHGQRSLRLRSTRHCLSLPLDERTRRTDS